MVSWILMFGGFFVGNVLYRSIRDGGVTLATAVGSLAVALITIGLISAVNRLRRRQPR
jgi:uncharacterized membrane-anchored protein